MKNEEQEGFWLFAGIGVMFFCLALGIGSCTYLEAAACQKAPNLLTSCKQ